MQVSTKIVTDIPGHHHRVPYFHRFAEALRMSGYFPGGAEVISDAAFAGALGMEWVKRNGGLCCVNASQLETIDPALGFLTLPFGLNDTVAPKGRLQETVELADQIAASQGIRIIGLMRGADQLFVHARPDIDGLADIAGLRTRVAGPGTYEELIRAFGGIPVVQPIPSLSDAVRHGRVDAVFTSPGAWAAEIRSMMPNGLRVPGAMMITYAVVCADEWHQGLDCDQQKSLDAACQTEITGKWAAMADDDQRLLDRMIAGGASVQTVVDLEEASRKVAPIRDAFSKANPEVFAGFQRIIG